MTGFVQVSQHTYRRAPFQFRCRSMRSTIQQFKHSQQLTTNQELLLHRSQDPRSIPASLPPQVCNLNSSAHAIDVFIELDLKSVPNPIVGRNHVEELNLGFTVVGQGSCGVHASDQIKVFFNGSGEVEDECFELLGEIFGCRSQMEGKFESGSFFPKDDNAAEYVKIVCCRGENWVV